MNKLTVTIMALAVSGTSLADVSCSGTVAEITKWSSSWDRNMSYSLEISGNRTPFIQVEDDESRSMILTAYAAQKTVNLKWLNSPNITRCTGNDTWNHYDKLTGYITIK